MRVVVQKVSQAAVTSTLEGASPETASIGRGLVALVGFERGDTAAECAAAAAQLLKLRLYPEPRPDAAPRPYAAGLAAAGRDLLLVSQFTLNATLKSGRPSFHRALGPDDARPLFEQLFHLCRDGLRATECHVRSGVFGAYMQLHLVNDGPFTVCLTCTDGKCTTW